MTTHIENLQASSSLKQILGLKWSPIGVRLVKIDEKPKDTPLEPTRLRYCQLLMEAKKGKSATLTPENTSNSRRMF